ncbi:glycosyltransferase family 2 protein [Thermodesulfobacteriota bacterium]
MADTKEVSLPVSVAVIAKNEEERLPDCLQSVSFAEETVVVDSGSEDNTTSVAESFGAKVLTEPWRGYSAQKQFAVDQCAHNWVLILDADERVPRETAHAIRDQLERSDSGIGGYSFQRKNYLHGRWVKHCGWWPDRIVRLVNKKRGGFDGRPVHEKWVTQGEVKDLNAVIEHISFRNYSELVSKMENYSNLAARELVGKGVNVNPLAPPFHGLWMFLRTYLLERGVLDGFDGFVISVMNGGGSFLKYAKARELAGNLSVSPAQKGKTD